MNFKHVMLAAALSYTSVSFAAEPSEALAFVLPEIATMSAVDTEILGNQLIAMIEAAESKDEFLRSLFESNKDSANVVYAAALQANMDQDRIIALALASGIDPTVMLAPTANIFGSFTFPSLPSFPLPPIPVPSPIGGGGGGGGVRIVSGN